MDYLIPVIIISIILSLCMIITSIVILRNSRKTKHTPADTIKPIVEQLAAIHKDLDTIRRNSVNTERNIATIKNGINTISASQGTDYYLSQTLSLKKGLGTISPHTPILYQKSVTSALPTQRTYYTDIYPLWCKIQKPSLRR